MESNVAAAQIFRALDREIWIVTSAHNGEQGGLTATWVSPASIDEAQPSMLVALAPNHHTATLVDGSGVIGLHLLKASQVELAYDFARRSGRDHNKLASVDFKTGTRGAPLLTDCLAALECQVYSRLATGDRIFYWADVVASEKHSDEQPLREQQLIQSLDEAQRGTLAAGRQQDIELQRPQQEAWRQALPAWLQPELPS